MSDYPHLLTNHTKLERQLERTSGEAVAAMENPIRTVNRPYECAAPLLPWLAWSRSVDYWRESWPEQTRRDVIAAAPGIHKKKGTRLSILRVFASVGIVADVIRDRSAADYTPHTYQVQMPLADNPGLLTGQINVPELLEYLENTQSERDGQQLIVTDEVEIERYAMALHTHAVAAAEPVDPWEVERPTLLLHTLGIADADPADLLSVEPGVDLFFFHSPAQNRSIH